MYEARSAAAVTQLLESSKRVDSALMDLEVFLETSTGIPTDIPVPVERQLRSGATRR